MIPTDRRKPIDTPDFTERGDYTDDYGGGGPGALMATIASIIAIGLVALGAATLVSVWWMS